MVLNIIWSVNVMTSVSREWKVCKHFGSLTDFMLRCAKPESSSISFSIQLRLFTSATHQLKRCDLQIIFSGIERHKSYRKHLHLDLPNNILKLFCRQCSRASYTYLWLPYWKLSQTNQQSMLFSWKIKKFV